MRRVAFLLFAAFCYSIPAVGDPTHVTLTYPVGGETFAPGTHVKVEWKLQVPHSQQNWDLYFSSDGGATWTAIQENIPTSITSFDWTVPEMETTHGRIKVVQDNSGLDYTAACPDFTIEAVATIAEGSGSVPASAELLASYPNPFAGSAHIQYVVREAGPVTLQVYDVEGHLVDTLVDGRKHPGQYMETFDAHGLADGTYLYRLTTPSRQLTLIGIHAR
jgi:hypothetical protein